MNPAETAEQSCQAAKQRLRESMRIALSEVAEEQARFAGGRIAEALSSIPEWRDASRVALFSSLPGEVDTRPIWDAARQASKSVLFPRVIPGTRLEFAFVEEPAQLEAGRFGVLQPGLDCSKGSLNAETLVLVPGLAFDRVGGRLGRGAGYYDRALLEASNSARMSAGSRPCRFGIGFELQIVSSVPMGRYDVKMDGVLTEAVLAEADCFRADAAQ